MRKEHEASGAIDRRRLLKGAGLTLGAASTAAAGQAVAAATTDETKASHRGYRETELVKTYYQAARF
jgi:hypothetical protein